MNKITVNRTALMIGLGAGAALLVGLIVALAFLLGRESARPKPVPVPSGAAQTQPTDPTSPALEPPPPILSPAGQDSQPLAQPGSAPAAPTKPGADPVRAAVAAYFQSLDRIQPGQMGGDPDSLAKGIIEGLGKGDSSGLDSMIQQSERARTALATLTAPAPCVQHRAESLAILDASVAVLRSIQTALQSGTAPADASARATQLQARTERLQQEEKALRQRYGLAPAA